jgi:putative SOS response-associated peptidase YedK
MPVIVERDDIDEWLDEGTPLLLRPAADGVLTVAEVSTRVNDARNEGPDLLTVSEPPPQLF